NFELGDYVLVADATTAPRGLNKLTPRFLGPYRIIEVFDNNTVRIDNNGRQLVNVQKLKKYWQRPGVNDVHDTPRRLLNFWMSPLLLILTFFLSSVAAQPNYFVMTVKYDPICSELDQITLADFNMKGLKGWCHALDQIYIWDQLTKQCSNDTFENLPK